MRFLEKILKDKSTSNLSAASKKSDLQRKESNRLQTAYRLLKTFRQNFPHVSSSACDDDKFDRFSCQYKSEGRSMRPKKESVAAVHSSVACRRDPERSQSFHEIRRLSMIVGVLPNEAYPALCERNVEPESDCAVYSSRQRTEAKESIYENVRTKPARNEAVASREESTRPGGSTVESGGSAVRQKRSFRKLTKDSGYETNYADYDYSVLKDGNGMECGDVEVAKSPAPAGKTLRNVSDHVTETGTDISSHNSLESILLCPKLSKSRDDVLISNNQYESNDSLSELERFDSDDNNPTKSLNEVSTMVIHIEKGSKECNDVSADDYVSCLRNSSYQILQKQLPSLAYNPSEDGILSNTYPDQFSDSGRSTMDSSPKHDCYSVQYDFVNEPNGETFSHQSSCLSACGDTKLPPVFKFDHEKFPSWPVTTTKQPRKFFGNVDVDHRSQSWPDHSEYIHKDKSIYCPSLCRRWCHCPALKPLWETKADVPAESPEAKSFSNEASPSTPFLDQLRMEVHQNASQLNVRNKNFAFQLPQSFSSLVLNKEGTNSSEAEEVSSSRYSYEVLPLLPKFKQMSVQQRVRNLERHSQSLLNVPTSQILEDSLCSRELCNNRSRYMPTASSDYLNQKIMQKQALLSYYERKTGKSASRDVDYIPADVQKSNSTNHHSNNLKKLQSAPSKNICGIDVSANTHEDGSSGKSESMSHDICKNVNLTALNEDCRSENVSTFSNATASNKTLRFFNIPEENAMKEPVKSLNLIPPQRPPKKANLRNFSQSYCQSLNSSKVFSSVELKKPRAPDPETRSGPASADGADCCSVGVSATESGEKGKFCVKPFVPNVPMGNDPQAASCTSSRKQCYVAQKNRNSYAFSMPFYQNDMLKVKTNSVVSLNKSQTSADGFQFSQTNVLHSGSEEEGAKETCGAVLRSYKSVGSLESLGKISAPLLQTSQSKMNSACSSSAADQECSSSSNHSCLSEDISLGCPSQQPSLHPLRVSLDSLHNPASSREHVRGAVRWDSQSTSNLTLIGSEATISQSAVQLLKNAYLSRGLLVNPTIHSDDVSAAPVFNYPTNLVGHASSDNPRLPPKPPTRPTIRNESFLSHFRYDKLDRQKSKEEIECEELRKRLAYRIPVHDHLYPVLVSKQGRKTISDYFKHLFDANSGKNETYLPSKSKKFCSQFSELNGAECASNLTDEQLMLYKVEFMSCLRRKLETLRSESVSVLEESIKNDQIAEQLLSRLQMTAQPSDSERYRRLLEDYGKISSLLLSLASQLVRTENNLLETSDSSNKESLEAKRTKLYSQLDEAKRLKQNIDERGEQLKRILGDHLGLQDLREHESFLYRKRLLLINAKELQENIREGEEQLAVLQDHLAVPAQ